MKELDALELRIRRPVPKRLTADCPAVELSRELERVLLEVERVPVHAWQDIPEEKLKDLAARAKASADVMEEAVGFLRASQSYDLEELDEEIVGAEDGGDDEDADPGGAPGRTSEVA